MVWDSFLLFCLEICEHRPSDLLGRKEGGDEGVLCKSTSLRDNTLLYWIQDPHHCCCPKFPTSCFLLLFLSFPTDLCAAPTLHPSPSGLALWGPLSPHSPLYCIPWSAVNEMNYFQIAPKFLLSPPQISAFLHTPAHTSISFNGVGERKKKKGNLTSVREADYF